MKTLKWLFSGGYRNETFVENDLKMNDLKSLNNFYPNINFQQDNL